MESEGEGPAPEPGWYVHVNGSVDHARVLGKAGIHGVRLVHHAGNWLLRIEHLQETFRAEGPEGGLNKAREVLAALNALEAVGLPWPGALESSFAFRLDEEGKGHIYGFFKTQMKVSARASVTVHKEGEEVETLDHIDLTTPALPHAVSTEARQRALRLLSTEASYRELMVAFEDAVEELGGRTGIEAAGVNWADVQRFNQTANSVEAAGDESRHGASKRVPAPRHPMSMEDARTMLLQIVSYWLRQPPP